MVVYMDDGVFVAVASDSLARVWVQGSPMASTTPFLGYTRWTDGDNDDTGDPAGRRLDRKLRRWITRSATEEVGSSCLFDMLEVKQKKKEMFKGRSKRLFLVILELSGRNWCCSLGPI